VEPVGPADHPELRLAVDEHRAVDAEVTQPFDDRCLPPGLELLARRLVRKAVDAEDHPAPSRTHRAPRSEDGPNDARGDIVPLLERDGRRSGGVLADAGPHSAPPRP